MSSIRPSVPLLDEASHTVRLLFGSRLDGIRNGNNANPADRIVPAQTSALATNAKKYLFAEFSPIVPSAAASASAGAIQNAGCAANPANQWPCTATCLSNGFDGPSPATGERIA